MYYLIPLQLIVNLMLGEFSAFIGMNIDKVYYRNFLFTGLPFFTLGYLTHNNQDKIHKISQIDLP